MGGPNPGPPVHLQQSMLTTEQREEFDPGDGTVRNQSEQPTVERRPATLTVVR